MIPDPALCFHHIYLIIPLLLLHLYMYYQISCTFGEISFLLYFSNHFYLKKEGHAEIISVMCSLFTFRVYSNIISFSWKKTPRNRFTLFLQYSQQTIIKRYIAYTCTGYWNIPWTAETQLNETPLGVVKMIGFVSLMIIMNWM